MGKCREFVTEDTLCIDVQILHVENFESTIKYLKVLRMRYPTRVSMTYVMLRYIHPSDIHPDIQYSTSMLSSRKDVRDI